jgi:riboflavin synthase
MFTGIVEEIGEIAEAASGVLLVRSQLVSSDVSIGDSVAVDGVDLTLTEIAADGLRFNVMPETYRLTTLGEAAPGRRVNLERSVRAADRLSGHIVRGVVEGVGVVASRADDGDAVIMTYDAPAELLDFIIERGPICIDGVSLTVIRKTESSFSVSVVAHTQRNTTILEREPGDTVNLESDIMMRYVANAVATLASSSKL